MRPQETPYRSPLDKPLDQLTDEDISQLTREDCRRYLKEKGMRRPSWNKSQAIQQVISLKSLLDIGSDSGAGLRQTVVSYRPAIPQHQVSSVSPAEEHVSYRRKDPPKPSFSGNVSAHLPSYDYNKAIPTTPSRFRQPVRQCMFESVRGQFEQKCRRLRIASITNETVGQMTIFYHGEVNVYDGVPATKAKAIMQLAGSSIYLPQDSPSGVNRAAVRSIPCHLQAAPDSPGSRFLATSSPTFQTRKVRENTLQYSMPHEVEPGPGSRKASLLRYLGKRKDRYSLKG